MIKSDTIFTNVALTADNQPWWEGKKHVQPAYDWQGRKYDPANGPAAPPELALHRKLSPESCGVYIKTNIIGHMKPIVFLGDSLDRLRDFPQTARRESGFQLDKVQRGLTPDDFKPNAERGQGRGRDSDSGCRAVPIESYTWLNWQMLCTYYMRFRKRRSVHQRRISIWLRHASRSW